MDAAAPVDTLIRTKGLRPTVSIREDMGSGLVYSATSHSFTRVTIEELRTLRRLSKGEESVWLASNTFRKWGELEWIGTEVKPSPCAEKPGRTKEHMFRPVRGLIIATTTCNASCGFCCAHPYLNAYVDKEFSSAEQVRHLGNRLHALGLMQCTISGGEPTLSSHLETLISALVRNAVFPIIVSNGTVWPAERYARNSAAGVSWTFSYLSNNAAEHDALMGLPGAHKKVSAVLRELSRSGLAPEANIVVTTRNLDYLETMIETLSDLGVRKVFLSQHLRMGRSREASLHPSALGSQAEMLARWQRRGVNILRGYRFRFLYETGPTLMQSLFPDFGGGCPAGLFECLVFPDGSVYPCDYLWEEKFCAGNLFDNGGIQRIANSTVFSMLHHLPADEVCLNCRYLKECKGGCPGIRYMHEGRLSYPNRECPLLGKQY
jgi:radical SAM protein with 4Fe4S-binding SPASM domain